VAVTLITIDAFLKASENNIIVDVRSPIEYEYAHIPNAFNIPIFSNQERAIIGTAYKQQSKEKAIAIGLKYFGNTINTYIKLATDFSAQNKSNKIYIHCARGGMRSEAMAHVLDAYGFEVYRLVDGYKAFRNWALQQFELDYNFKIIGGRTGSGKTTILKAIQKLGGAIIDLEGLANHKGSAFGNINMPPQPKQEMWENELAIQLYKNKNNLIYLEDESQRIGNVQIPNALWYTIRLKQLLYLDIPLQIRHTNIITDYGKLNTAELKNAVLRIAKKLGGLDTKNIINCFNENNINLAFGLLLTYYDKQYDKATNTRENIEKIKVAISLENFEIEYIAAEILKIK
jgi:tRNA 2-selenouridine synthase